uniref:Uncharacterized protein n=1 Tax=Daphnia galeata TaxID=27404 RepID=A0A8J2WHR2_9CRUS|nr:unnamed protein product [Daphnia galeata]
MAQGLMDQFQIAGQQPAPKVLYTDLDCGFSKFKMMFNKLGRNGYRLDSWYLCADLQPLPPESHPLHGNFMVKFSELKLAIPGNDFKINFKSQHGNNYTHRIPSDKPDCELTGSLVPFTNQVAKSPPPPRSVSEQIF